MANIREIQKKDRLAKLGGIVAALKEKGEEIDKDYLISMMIVQHGISKKTAVEEIEAIMLYYEK